MKIPQISKESHNEIEKSFHDNYAGYISNPLADQLVNIDIWELESWNYILSIMGDIDNKTVLDVGCGFGRESILLAKKGAVVTGIDISDRSIDVANRCASAQGISDIDFKVLKVEDLSLNDKFDIIFCRGSLHHFYDVKNVTGILYSCLNKEGMIIVQEPKAENPIAVIGRKYFNWSTSTEHPFKKNELYDLFNDIFGNSNVTYFNLISPLCFVFEKIKFINSNTLKKYSFKALNPIDKLLLSYSWFKQYAWIEIVWSIKK